MIDLDTLAVETDLARAAGSDVAVSSDLDGYGRRLVGTIDHMRGLYGDNDYGYSYPFSFRSGDGNGDGDGYQGDGYGSGNGGDGYGDGYGYDVDGSY